MSQRICNKETTWPHLPQAGGKGTSVRRSRQWETSALVVLKVDVGKKQVAASHSTSGQGGDPYIPSCHFAPALNNSVTLTEGCSDCWKPTVSFISCICLSSWENCAFGFLRLRGFIYSLAKKSPPLLLQWPMEHQRSPPSSVFVRQRHESRLRRRLPSLLVFLLFWCAGQDPGFPSSA